MRPIVVIHTNDQQMPAALVSAHSLKSRSKNPDGFDVRFLRLEETPYLLKRQNDSFLMWSDSVPQLWRRQDLQSFAPLRRMVPALLNFRGRALVIDPDVFAIGDVYQLLSRDMEGKAILCRQKSQCREGRRLYSSAVMLLDCGKLTHWDWHRDIDEIFARRLPLGPWLNLLDESPERIGLFEEEWNHYDTLTERTKLLHNTNISTQPWRTGLRLDREEFSAEHSVWLRKVKRFFKQAVHRDKIPRYVRHPDWCQERLFFTLLKECIDERTVTPGFVREAIRKNYLRKDAFARLAEVDR